MENQELKASSRKFAFEIKYFVRKYPKDFVTYNISEQLLRAAMSVGANTRAAFRGRSRKEFIAKLGIVIEESDECSFWLDMLTDETQIDQIELKKLENEAVALTKILFQLNQSTIKM